MHPSHSSVGFRYDKRHGRRMAVAARFACKEGGQLLQSSLVVLSDLSH